MTSNQIVTNILLTHFFVNLSDSGNGYRREGGDLLSGTPFRVEGGEGGGGRVVVGPGVRQPATTTTTTTTTTTLPPHGARLPEPRGGHFDGRPLGPGNLAGSDLGGLPPV